jgi:REP element-mobilizing transposase RayT
MPDDRRYRVPGGCYSFTVNLLERAGDDLLVRHIDLLRRVVRAVGGTRPFTVDAWVVLLDHLHCVLTLPKGNDDFPSSWRLIKMLFASPRLQGPTCPDAWRTPGGFASGNHRATLRLLPDLRNSIRTQP